MVNKEHLPKLWERLIGINSGIFYPGRLPFIVGAARFNTYGFEANPITQLAVGCRDTVTSQPDLEEWLLNAIHDPLRAAQDAIGTHIRVESSDSISFHIVSMVHDTCPDWVKSLQKRSGGHVYFFGQSEAQRALDRHSNLAEEFDSPALAKVETLKSELAQCKAEVTHLEQDVKAYMRELTTFASHKNRRQSEDAWATMLGETQHKLRTQVDEMYLQAESIADNPAGSHVTSSAASIVKACIEASKRLGQLELRDVDPLNKTDVPIKQVAGTLRSLASELCIDDRIHIGKEGSITVDSDALVASIRELVNNARHWIKESSTNGKRWIKMHVRLTGVESGGTNLEITIEDNGPGVPNKIKELIFHPTMTSRKDGKGRGLAIVRRFCQGHDGEIKETGIYGKGACFVMRLPIAVKEALS